MKSLRLLLYCFLISGSLQAQSISITGKVLDTLNTPLIGATVMLLQAQDSVLVKFGITDEVGYFKLEISSSQQFILQVSYLGYKNWSQPISAENQTSNVAVGNLKLYPESALLEAVEVKADHLPIHMKKDTIEYNAIAFQTKPNADVEALLKKLPGVEVDRNGAIKAQGETVQQVLVDGKSFFGNDPKIATKNLPADAVEKVQVFDKKSDIAEFSGIDDGRAAKTINLSLKEDKKQGYFGRVQGGYGNQQRYEGKFNINRFGNGIQFSSLGMFNNTNQQGFSINDYINMMGGLNNLLAGGGGELRLDSDDVGLPLDVGPNNQGFITTSAGGVNFNWEINNNAQLHSSYFYNGIERDFTIQEQTESLLGNQSFHSTSNYLSQQQNNGHGLNINLTSKLDSFQTIKWRTNIGFTKTNNQNHNSQQTYNTTNNLENASEQTISTYGKSIRWNSNVIYLRKFKKKGRFFTSNAAFEKRQQDQQRHLEALNSFFENLPFQDSLNQEQDRTNDQINYGIAITYTEPIGKAKYLETNYSFQNYSNDLNREVYDIQKDNRSLNTNLSNYFLRDYLYHRMGMNFKWAEKKWMLNMGIHAQNSILKGDLVSEAISIQNNFLNFLPNANFEYDFKATRSLNVSYRTKVREPSLEELQPIVDNSDPLNIYKGNPALRPEYTHVFSTNFNSFDQFSSISIFANLTAAFTNHKILHASFLDKQFRQSSQPVNFGNDSRLGAYLSFGAPLKLLKGRINLTTNWDAYQGYYLVNDFANQYHTNRWSGDLNYSNRNTDKIEVVLGYKWTGNWVQYKGESNQNQAYQQQIFYTDFTWNFTDSWTINTTIDYNKYSTISFGAPTSTAIWQAGLSFHFLNNKRGTISFTAKDLLNQNLGINRTSQLNFLQEQRIASLGRYYMLSLRYALSAFGGADAIKVNRRR